MTDDTAFEARREALVPERPDLGRVALIPWDSQIFGFTVGELELGPGAHTAQPELAAALAAWASRHAVELVAAAVPSRALRSVALLGGLGFTFVDLRLSVRLTRLASAELPAVHATIRDADPEDLPELERIAATAFRHGRYHTDGRFPRELAERRFVWWVARALATRSAEHRLYVLGPRSEARGFFHVRLGDGTADLRLGGVATHLQLGTAGFALYAGTLRAVREAGARTATASLSAANTGVLNIFGALGFTATRPESVFHWHAPGASHLTPPPGRSE